MTIESMPSLKAKGLKRLWTIIGTKKAAEQEIEREYSAYNYRATFTRVKGRRDAWKVSVTIMPT